MPSKTDLDALRGTLSEERGSLRRQLAELSADELSAYDENFADSGQVAAEQGEARTLETSLREQLGDVDRALAKFDKGTYGVCEKCSEKIADARLEAMPATRYCINDA